MAMKNEIWSEGLSNELTFWDNWMASKGGDWPADFAFRCDPETTLQDHLTMFLDAPEGSVVRILDVGAGPLTLLGKKWSGRNVEIVPTDALADEYDALLRKHNIIPPIRTIQVKAEELTAHFPPDCFDMVHANNCIDHSENPTAAIENMLKVVRPGAFVLLFHAVREGERESYEGLHKWDFYSRDNAFFIDGGNKTVNVSDYFHAIADTTCREENEWLSVMMRKRVVSQA